MAARRTQIYLDESLRRRIDRVRAQRGETMAEVVRDALDLYLGREERARRPLAEIAPTWVGAWSGSQPEERSRRGLEDRARRLGY